MSPAPVTPEQIRRIHVLKRDAGLSELDYRDALAGYGVASSKHLTAAEAGYFIHALDGLPKVARKPSARRPAQTATGPYAAILRALWLSAWNLGVARSRDDAALIKFVERQTKIAHTRFLRDAADAAKAIEALKAWIAREGGVRWPAKRDDDGKAAKIAVLEAQWRRLVALGAVESFGDPEQHDGLADYVAKVARGSSKRFSNLADPTVTPAELDAGAAALGRKLRAAQAKQRS